MTSGGDPHGGHGKADRTLHRTVSRESRFEREAVEGLRSRLQGGGREEGGRRGAVERRHRAALGVPGAPRGAGHPRRPGGAPGPRRRGQGRDDPARDEWGQPPGRAGRELQGPIRARARSGLPTPLPGTAAVAGRDRDLQSLPLRGGAGCPRASREPRAPEAPDRRRASTTSGNAGTKRSTTGSGISPATGFGSSRSSSTSRRRNSGSAS